MACGEPLQAFHGRLKLLPAAQSIDRLIVRARRPHEQGDDRKGLRRYVRRWYAWLHGGLRGHFSTKGRFIRVWVTELKRLHLTGDGIHPR